MRNDKRLPFQQPCDPATSTHPTKHRREARKPWVLLGEDDADMRELLCHVLEGRGYRVSVATDGQELSSAIEEAMRREKPALPDLLISDVRMPKLSGLSVLKSLRSAGWDIPVIMITAFPDQHVRRSVDQLEAALLAKPFAVHDLLRRVDAITDTDQH